jgi:hypothetical protein
LEFRGVFFNLGVFWVEACFRGCFFRACCVGHLGALWGVIYFGSCLGSKNINLKFIYRNQFSEVILTDSLAEITKLAKPSVMNSISMSFFKNE